MEKCKTTGKVIFGSLGEARDAMLTIRLRSSFRWNGRWLLHRQGKPAQKRGYFCWHCGGYHLTSWKVYKKEKAEHAFSDKLIIRWYDEKYSLGMQPYKSQG